MLMAVAVTAALAAFVIVVGRADRPVRVTVRSEPARATVFENDRRIGITPLDLVVTPGAPRSLRLVLRDHEDGMARIDAPPLKAPRWRDRLDQSLFGRPSETVLVRLDSTLSAAVAVTSDPSGADVYLDGRSIGLTPVARADLAPGDHTVRVERQGFFPVEKTVSLEAGKETTLHVPLQNRWEVLYRERIAQAPLLMTNYSELAHDYVMRGLFDQAAQVLRDGIEAASKPHAQENGRFFDEAFHIYTRYYQYPAGGDDTALRSACRAVIETARDRKLLPAQQAQNYLKQMDQADKSRPSAPKP